MNNEFLKEKQSIINTWQTKIYSKINLYITGYGPFHGITNNPSELLANKIKENKEMIEKLHNNQIQIKEISIMDVDVDYVKDYLTKLHEKILADDEKDQMHIVINMGVNANITKSVINLETTAKNYIYDGVKYDGKIIEDSDIKEILCKLDLNLIQNILGKEISELSNDAGSYLCNYSYFFNSFYFKNKENFYCEFIHLPDNQHLSTEKGLNNFILFISAIYNLYVKK